MLPVTLLDGLSSWLELRVAEDDRLERWL
jgi:hypothetical protein